MTVPDPSRPTSGMDPMPSRRPRPPFPGDLPPHELPDDIPDPAAPGRPDDPTRRRERAFVGVGTDDRRRHVVDVTLGEAGDPTGLRARCGAPVEQVVPGLRAEQADCPDCLVRGSSAASPH
jgi:hypothetical protein